jgi:urate oxidase
MAIVLGHNNYGKSDIRIVKVVRGAERHELRDLTVDAALEGAFEAAHLEGDNAGLIATDTMRNTAYALAARDPLDHLETFGRRLVEHFVETGPTVTRAKVRIAEAPWARIDDHPHAFQRGYGGVRVATVSGNRDDVTIEAGIDDLLVLKTTESGWSGFLRERYTSLPDNDDRIMATIVTARWVYDPEANVDYTATWHGVRDLILSNVGDHYSHSVQYTLHRMGTAVLEAHDGIERIHLSLPNKHHLLYDLSRFGVENDGVVFHATSEPYGLIEGTVVRERVSSSPAPAESS